jgi:hypothetical protein
MKSKRWAQCIKCEEQVAIDKLPAVRDLPLDKRVTQPEGEVILE